MKEMMWGYGRAIRGEDEGVNLFNDIETLRFQYLGDNKSKTTPCIFTQGV